MLWNVAEPEVDGDIRRLYGLCQACHDKYVRTLVAEHAVTVADIRTVAGTVRENGRKPAGNCLQKSIKITETLQERGIPATVRTAPFGADEQLHYVCLFHGGFVDGITDELCVVDATLTQFEGRAATDGEDVTSVPPVVILPKSSEAAGRWYASLSPPTCGAPA